MNINHIQGRLGIAWTQDFFDAMKEYWKDRDEILSARIGYYKGFGSAITSHKAEHKED